MVIGVGCLVPVGGDWLVANGMGLTLFRSSVTYLLQMGTKRLPAEDDNETCYYEGMPPWIHCIAGFHGGHNALANCTLGC